MAAIIGTLLALILIVGGVLFALFLPLSPFYIGGNSTPTATSSAVAGGTPAGDKGCGVTKTSNGYTFSQLHVAKGMLMTSTNCAVTLKGFNWSQLEFGNAVGGPVTNRISEQSIAWYNQNFHMNVWRIPLNSYWWNTNVNVPLAKMNYQSWIGQIIKWSEQNGDYVILTKGPQFHAPPCGGDVKLCPSQNYGAKVNDPTQTTSGAYVNDAVTMWTSIASMYKNDPAVLYDSWNEMHNLSPQLWQQQENTLINTIRAQNPNSVVFLGGANYKGDINALVQKQVPDFTQSNLIYDFHVYDGYNGDYLGKRCSEPSSYVWKNWPDNANQQVQFAQQHGKAVSFTEWGGCNDFSQYNQDLTAFARQYHVSMTYYDETNVAKMSGGSYKLTQNGLQVQAAYALF